MEMTAKSFAACSTPPPLSVVRPLPRATPMSARWDGQITTPAMSEGPLSAASSRWNRTEETLTPGSVSRKPSRSYRDFVDSSGTPVPHLLYEMQNMMHEFSGQFRTPEGHFCNDCRFFKSEQQRLEAEFRELVDALHVSKRQNEYLESEIVRIESENRVDKDSDRRRCDQLNDLVEDLQRDKKLAERNCEAFKNEATNLRSYISGLPSSVDFAKLKFDLYAKTQECETLRNSRSSLKTELEAQASKNDILQEDLNNCRANCEELRLQLAKEKTQNENQERRRQLASSVEPDNIEALLTARDELSTENKKLKQMMVAKEKASLKEKEQVKAIVGEKSRQISGLKSDVERLDGELGDATRLNELLRSQVCSRTAERDTEREKVAALKTELHVISRSQEGRQDLARLEQKLCCELTRCVHELKNLLEIQDLIQKGQVPDSSLILGFDRDESEKVKPQDIDGKICELKKHLSEMTDLRRKITELRHFVWDQLSSHWAETVAT